jgi:simple sugar transport system permease protein
VSDEGGTITVASRLSGYLRAGGLLMPLTTALLGRHTAFGSVVAALLVGALLHGTSVRNLDPAIFDPQLAGNLTWIIQGLIVLFVSAPVLLTYLSPGRLRRRLGRRRAAEARAG